jgi:ribosome-associated protein
MTITKLQRTVIDALEDIKAQDIRVFNTTGLSDLFDRVVVASATSNRQTRSLASHVREKAKEKGFPVISTEGEDSGEWVLVDLGDMVVHIMQPAIRAYYNLEELWGAKPVRVKIGVDNPARPRLAAQAGAVMAKPPGAVKAPDARKLTPNKSEALKARRKAATSGSAPRPTITALRRVRTAKAAN